MVNKTNFNYSDENINKSKEELIEERKNKIFVEGMLKRMNQEHYI